LRYSSLCPDASTTSGTENARLAIALCREAQASSPAPVSVRSSIRKQSIGTSQPRLSRPVIHASATDGVVRTVCPAWTIIASTTSLFTGLDPTKTKWKGRLLTTAAASEAPRDFGGAVASRLRNSLFLGDLPPEVKLT
jgi:hypothetical protein